MRKYVYGCIAAVLGVIAVLLAREFLSPYLTDQPLYIYYIVMVFVGIAGVAIALLIAPPVINWMERTSEKLSASATQITPIGLISSAVGLISGLVIASLIGLALARIAVIGTYLAILVEVILGYIGLMTGYRYRENIGTLFSRNREPREKTEKPSRADKKDKQKFDWQAAPKVLDTSVIIDGRVSDVYRTGFLEGDLIVANFVLEELRHIADSSDVLKRNRGRGGLDCLNAMREEFGNSIIVNETDYPEIAEVDSKLLRLAQDLHGCVVTNDFNLNKVAQLQGVKVLNINELSNAVKPVVLPGEEMQALIVKEGKEANQGVAYLDDGTMIVVENGRRYLGRRLLVIVTSILQTSAGRMVFAKPKLNRQGEAVDVSD